MEMLIVYVLMCSLAASATRLPASHPDHAHSVHAHSVHAHSDHAHSDHSHPLRSPFAEDVDSDADSFAIGESGEDSVPCFFAFVFFL